MAENILKLKKKIVKLDVDNDVNIIFYTANNQHKNKLVNSTVKIV